MLDTSTPGSESSPFPMHNLGPIPELYVSADSAQKLKVEAGEPPSATT